MTGSAGSGLLADGGLATVAGLAAVVLAVASLLGSSDEPAKTTTRAAPVEATPSLQVTAPEVLRGIASGRPLVVYVAAAPCRSCLDGARARGRRAPAAAHRVRGCRGRRHGARRRCLFRAIRWPRARLLDERGALVGSLDVRILPTTLVLNRRRSIVLRIEGTSGAAAEVRAARGVLSGTSR